MDGATAEDAELAETELRDDPRASSVRSAISALSAVVPLERELARVIVLEGVSKSFGRLRALDGVSFTVGKGEIVGFLGPNGAGKTTALRILCGYLSADAGRVMIDGVDVAADPIAAQRRLGYLPEGAPAYHEMRVVDYLAHRARLRGARVGRELELAHITDVARRPIGQLSKGMRQRVGLAGALLGDPPVLILDEPTAGLDPNQARETRALLAELGRERTVLLSTHILAEVEALGARPVVILGGRIVDGAPAAVTRVRVRPADGAAAVAALGEGAAAAGEGLVTTPLEPAEAARRLVAAGIDVVEIARRSLEDLFAALTT